MILPITQSKEWYKLQNDLGEETFFEETDSYYFLAINKHTPVGNYLFLPYGPVAKDEKGFSKSISRLTELAKSKHAIFIRIEPQDPEFINLFPPKTIKSKEINPADTWILSLKPSREELILGFSHGVRNPYNTARKRGLIVETTKDPAAISHLVKLQHALARERHINTYSESYLKAELSQPFATLYLVKYQKPADIERTPDLPADGQILAASLFFDYKGTRYYMQSAADSRYKKLPATVALLATAVIDAKEQGNKYFDFWGIAPDGADSSHPWYGFTKFKKSFGGQAVHYAGTHDIILKPFRYRIYQSIRIFGKILHH